MKEDFGNRFDERKRRWEERIERRSSHGHIWTGIFILLIGVAALIKASVTDLPDWLFSWQTLLIALGFFIGFKHGFKGPAWLVLILVGSAFLLRDVFPDMDTRRYVWPIILIIIGGFMVLRPRRHSWQWDEDQKKNSPGSGPDEATVIDETYNAKEDFIDSTCFFGGNKKNIISKNFKGGDIVCIFGGAELDLSQADFTKPATLEITTIFGGTKLIIPSNWEIKSEVVNIFGGIEDKRKMQTITTAPEKILILKGNVLFGGIEIKSY